MAVDLCDRAQWDALAEKADPGFYGRSDWLDAICGATGMEPQYVVVTARETPVLRAALARKRRWGQEFLLTPASAAYAGWAEAFPDDLAPERREARRIEVADELAAWCEDHAAWTRIVLPPEMIDARAFIWRGWRAEVRYTYRTSAADDAATAMHENARRQVKKAARLTVACPEGVEAVRALAAVIEPTFRRQGEPLPTPAAAWRAYLDALVGLPSVRIVAAFDGETPHAAMALGFDTHRAYELLAGTSEEGLASGASALVMQAAMREAAACVGELDLAGANIPSIARFKRGFGGRLVPYIAVSHAGSTWSRWLATGAPRLRRRLGFRR